MYVVRVRSDAVYLVVRGLVPNPQLGTTATRNRAEQFTTREQAEEYMRLARAQYEWDWVVEQVQG